MLSTTDTRGNVRTVVLSHPSTGLHQKGKVAHTGLDFPIGVHYTKKSVFQLLWRRV
jgi:hypothetical protein